LTPFATTIGNLRFEEFECVEAEIRIGDLEPLAKDGTRFVLDKEEAAMSLVASNFLHDMKVVDSGEEIAE
jgi:hypothetical protein